MNPNPRKPKIIIRRVVIKAWLVGAAIVAMVAGSVTIAPAASKSPRPAPVRPTGAVVLRSFAGLVEGTEGFLAVETAGTDAIAYFCDGAQTAVWFAGTASKAKASLKSAAGAVLTLRPAKSGAKGTLTLAGKKLAIDVEAVAPPSGLYVLDPSLPHETLARFLGGWVVLPDGTVKGAIKEKGVVVSNPQLDLTGPSTGLPTGDTVKTVPFGGFGGTGPGAAQIGGQFGGGQFQGGAQLGGQFGQFGGGGQLQGGGNGQLGGGGQFQGSQLRQFGH